MPLEDGWVVRFETADDGPRVAIKDAIDVAGWPTLVGSPAVEVDARPAARDAACVAAIRTAGGAIVGKTALTELCWDESGINALVGTPLNPRWLDRVPGGSSSGSAVVVARGEADVALGTDTGGSVRIPAACCGIVGLKTTHGRISLDGVYPLAPTFDTVGPLSRDVAGVVLGMRLLEPGFAPVVPSGRPRIARLRPDIEVDPVVDRAIDRLLAVSGWEVVELRVAWWTEIRRRCGRLLGAEGARANGRLLAHRELLSADAIEAIEGGLAVDDEGLGALHAAVADMRERIVGLFADVDALALPTLPRLPPTLAGDVGLVQLTFPVNVAGLPALAMPAPTGGPIDASIQLVGRAGDEERLLGLGLALGA